MRLRRNLVIAAMPLAFMGAGFTGVAAASGGSASPSGSHSQSTSQGNDKNEVKGHEGKEAKEAKEAESPGDQARQVQACKAAGISPSATNIDYNDETGVCRLDTGGDQGGED